MEGGLSALPVTRPDKPSVLLSVCPFILVNELCERITFYGLSTNLVVYLREVMAVDAGGAAVQVCCPQLCHAVLLLTRPACMCPHACAAALACVPILTNTLFCCYGFSIRVLQQHWLVHHFLRTRHVLHM
jgi:hypothetical protein